MIKRTILNRLKKTKKSILLLGARQVGKSTLVKSLTPDRIINLADEAIFLSYSKDSSLLRRELSALPKSSLIVIDEVQRVPSLLNTLQAILDEGSQHRFILTGSSARKLKRGGANLLPGRILLEYLDPLSFWELDTHFDLEKVLRIGTLPGIYLDPKEGEDVLETYATVYLKEEIQAEAIAKNIGAYARFLDVAAQASGDWINYSKISSDSEIPKETIRRFYSILEDTLVAFRIPSFKPTISKRRVSQRDKFVFFDIGVRNAILGIHKSKISPTEIGKLFEQWLLLQILYYVHSEKKNWKVSCYRSDTGIEVDIVIDVGEQLLAIECKYGRNAMESELRSLRAFEEISGKPTQKFLVYQGSQKQKFSKGELAIPYQEFLAHVLPRI